MRRKMRRPRARRAAGCLTGPPPGVAAVACTIGPYSQADGVGGLRDGPGSRCRLEYRSAKPQSPGLRGFLAAGDPGIEPGVAVLETTVLPIHQSPEGPDSMRSAPAGRPSEERARGAYRRPTGQSARPRWPTQEPTPKSRFRTPARPTAPSPLNQTAP